MGLPLRRRRRHGTADFDGISPTGQFSRGLSNSELADLLQFLKDTYAILSVPLSQLATPLAMASPTAGLITACLTTIVTLVSGVWIVRSDYKLRRRQETRRADTEAEAIRVRGQVDVTNAGNRRLEAEVGRLQAEVRQLHTNEAKARADYRSELHQARLDLRTRAERAERQADRYYGELQRLRASPSPSPSH